MVNRDELRLLLRGVAEELQALFWSRRRSSGKTEDAKTAPTPESCRRHLVELRVPRDRQGRFRPSLFAPYAGRTLDLSDLVLERVEEFRKRPLQRSYAVVYLDALFVKVLRRGTKVRDRQFPKPEAIYKLVYLESERQGGKDKGFVEAQGELERMFTKRYPAPQNLTQNP